MSGGKMTLGGKRVWVWKVPRQKGRGGKGEAQLTICVLIRTTLTRFQEGVDLIYRESAIGHCEGEARMLKNLLS